MSQRFKALIAAYACDPRQGSEPGVGWEWVHAIAAYHDLWVLTAERHRAHIEQARAEDTGRLRNVRFHYIPRTRRMALERIWPPAYFWTYRQWQRAAYRLGARLHDRVGFDLAHTLTYVGFRVPGYLWRLDIPLVWGPIGGLENTPWRFLPALGAGGLIHFAGRNIINSLHKRFLPLPRRAFGKAKGNLIAATAGIREEILRHYGLDSEVICEIGPPPGRAPAPSRRDPGDPLRLVWNGRHLPGKALPLLLDALPGLPADVLWTLDILGDGPQRRKWERRAEARGIANRCRWHGHVPRARAIATVAASHVFVITSLKDLTSSVLLEALAQGVPVICPDHCGFSNVVTGDCGVKIPLRSPRQFVARLAAVIEHLDRDEPERNRLALGALRRIEDFSWEEKARRVDLIYRRAVAGYAAAHAGEHPAPD